VHGQSVPYPLEQRNRIPPGPLTGIFGSLKAFADRLGKGPEVGAWPRLNPPLRRDEGFVFKLHRGNRAVGDPHPAASGIGVLNPFIVERPELAGLVDVDPAAGNKADGERVEGERGILGGQSFAKELPGASPMLNELGRPPFASVVACRPPAISRSPETAITSRTRRGFAPAETPRSVPGWQDAAFAAPPTKQG
jgi:hypothetical protein